MRDPHGPMNAHEHPNSHDATRRRTARADRLLWRRGDNRPMRSLSFALRYMSDAFPADARVSVRRCFQAFFLTCDIQHTRLYAREQGQGRPPTTVVGSVHTTDWTGRRAAWRAERARRVVGDERKSAPQIERNHVDINIDCNVRFQVYTDQWTTSSASRCPAAEQ